MKLFYINFDIHTFWLKLKQKLRLSIIQNIMIIHLIILAPLMFVQVIWCDNNID